MAQCLRLAQLACAAMSFRGARRFDTGLCAGLAGEKINVQLDLSFIIAPLSGARFNDVSMTIE